ncbi:MAG: 4Fe-4S binding protein [Bacteroidales bacterium]|nr:4Fe-4S binding protein [Bacteroidales bacterium]
MINKLLQKKSLPIVLKLVMLPVFIGLMVIGFMAHSTDAAILKELRNTNLANLLVWSYWWPLIILSAIVFGRIWCMVCPAELITSFFSKNGLRLRRPQWLLSGWAISIFYLIILIIGLNIFAIHRNPAYMAAYLSAIMLSAIIIGFLFEKNTFCAYVCPVGYLLGVYARIAPWGWRVKNASVCESCIDKSCISKDYHYAMNVKSCGVDLYPPKISDNSECILCAGCLKSCKEHQSETHAERPNPGFVKVGFADGLYKGQILHMAEWFFLFIVSGFVIYEILSEFKAAKALLLFIPDFVSNSLGIKSAIMSSIIQSLYLFFFLPAIFWFFPYLILRMGKTRISLNHYLRYFGLAFIPLVAAAHVCKSILKAVSRIPYFEHLSVDYTGKVTTQLLLQKDIVLSPLPAWTDLLISIVLTMVLMAGFLLSLKVIKRVMKRLSPQATGNAWLWISLPYFLVFFICIILWRWL